MSLERFRMSIVVVAVALLLAAAWASRFESVLLTSRPGAYLLDRWTGSVLFIDGDEATEVKLAAPTTR